METERWIDVKCACGLVHKVRVVAWTWKSGLDYGVNMDYEVLYQTQITPAIEEHIREEYAEEEHKATDTGG